MRLSCASFFCLPLVISLLCLGMEAIAASSSEQTPCSKHFGELSSNGSPQHSGISAGRNLLRKLNYVHRQIAGFYPIPQHLLLPRAVRSISNDVLMEADKAAFALSRSNANREVQFIEALDKDGTVIFRTSLDIGSLTSVRPLNVAEEFFKGVNSIYPDAASHQIFKIRMVHTHPPVPGASLLSFEDADSMLRFHAVFEYMGLNSVVVEESIIYSGRGGATKKKTLVIPSSSLSFQRGDYSLGFSGDKQVGQMFKTPKPPGFLLEPIQDSSH